MAKPTEDMTHDELLERHKGLSKNNKRMSKLMESRANQINSMKKRFSRTLNDMRIEVAALLEMKLEEMHESDIPISDSRFRLMLLTIEAVDPGSTPHHRLQCIQKAEEMFSKHPKEKKPAKKQSKKERIKEEETLHNEPLAGFSTELVDDEPEPEQDPEKVAVEQEKVESKLDSFFD